MDLISNEKNTPTLCLNMIVKNEGKIITRLLESVSHIIDCYCICDTGSTDNTINIIKNFFQKKNIPGKVIVEPFKNFCHNRNFAMKSCLGMSDFVLLLDADMCFKVNNFDKKQLLEYDSFCILQGNDSFYYYNMRIVKNNGLYNYVGVTHEYIDTPPNNRNRNLNREELFINDIGDGGSKSDKFERDVRLLLDGIKEEPNNVRYHFYLANSYHDLGRFGEAINMYKKIRDKDYQRTYGITLDDYNKMFNNQKGKCAICRMPETAQRKDKAGPLRLAVDHNHKTNKVRGLLCMKCNVVLGYFEKHQSDITKVSKYLEKHK
jgi:glycosyltransferase involved in cell wall biosynthesis